MRGFSECSSKFSCLSYGIFPFWPGFVYCRGLTELKRNWVQLHLFLRLSNLIWPEAQCVAVFDKFFIGWISALGVYFAKSVVQCVHRNVKTVTYFQHLLPSSQCVPFAVKKLDWIPHVRLIINLDDFSPLLALADHRQATSKQQVILWGRVRRGYWGAQAPYFWINENKYVFIKLILIVSWKICVPPSRSIISGSQIVYCLRPP